MKDKSFIVAFDRQYWNVSEIILSTGGYVKVLDVLNDCGSVNYRMRPLEWYEVWLYKFKRWFTSIWKRF